MCTPYPKLGAAKLLADNGNLPLEFDVDDRSFAITIRRRRAG